jgi:purine-binding chemotaxis protein CheW
VDTEQEDEDMDLNQYLTFVLSDEEYGVDILRVQEIKGWEETVPMPDTPDYVKGVINLRDVVVPIVDLRERFKMKDITYDDSTVVIVIRVVMGEDDDADERTIGVVVDAVSDVFTIEKEKIKSTMAFGSSISKKYINGIATVTDDKMVILLNIDQLINEDILADIASDQE